MSTVTSTVSGSISARGPSASAPPVAPPVTSPDGCQQAILCEVQDGGIGVILREPVVRGERFSLVITPWLPDSDHVIQLEAAWCAGLRAGLRPVAGGAPEGERLLRALQGWLLEGGRLITLAPAPAGDPVVECAPAPSRHPEKRVTTGQFADRLRRLPILRWRRAPEQASHRASCPGGKLTDGVPQPEPG